METTWLRRGVLGSPDPNPALVPRTMLRVNSSPILTLAPKLDRAMHGLSKRDSRLGCCTASALATQGKPLLQQSQQDMAPYLPAKHWQTFRMPSQPAETLDELATLAHNQLAQVGHPRGHMRCSQVRCQPLFAMSQGLVDEARATFQRLAVAQAEVLTAKAAQLLLRDETDVAARGSVPCSSSGALCSCTAQPKPATAPAHTEAIATGTTCDVADDWESCDVASFAPVPVSTSLKSSNLPSSAVIQGSRQPGSQAAVSDQDQAWAAAVGLGPLTQAPLP
ncbi:hypothetical protein HaLaN_01001, partial [Haematococcus lacustris]